MNRPVDSAAYGLHHVRGALRIARAASFGMPKNLERLKRADAALAIVEDALRHAERCADGDCTPADLRLVLANSRGAS